MSEQFKISQSDFEILEQYVAGALIPEDLAEFEKRLKNDKALQLQLEEFKILIAGVEHQSLFDKLNDFHAEIDNDKTTDKIATKRFSILRFSIAASLALIIGFGGLWIYIRSNSNQNLYSEYFKPDPGLPTVMGANDNFEFYDAMVDYKRREYKSAIEKWEVLLAEKSKNDTLNYFLGVAYLAKENQLKTIEYLSKVVGNGNGIFYNDANFYLGLAYLKNNETEKSLPYFQKCGNNKCLEILEKINKSR